MYACFSSLHVHPFGGLPLGLAPGFFWAGLEFLLPNGRPRFFFSTPLSVAAAAFFGGAFFAGFAIPTGELEACSNGKNFKSFSASHSRLRVRVGDG